jgi:hypothetical protein
MSTESVDSQRRGMLLIDGPNVMYTIKDIIEAHPLEPELEPWNDNLPDYEVVAKWLQKKFDVLASNFDKCFFLKKIKDAENNPEKVEKQDGFVKALRDRGWYVFVRDPAPGTEYGDKQNDIDEDIIDKMEEFLATSKPGDVLAVMSNDFNITPGTGRSFRQTLIDARAAGLNACYVSFRERVRLEVLVTGGLMFFDSRDMEGAYKSIPPLPARYTFGAYGRYQPSVFSGQNGPISTEATTLLPPPAQKDS